MTNKMILTHSPFAMPNLDINSLIRDLPGFAIIKDLDSNYLNANLNTVNEFGLKNSEHLLQYSDLTIPHALSQNGQFYRNLDLEVIETKQSMRGICTFPFQGSILPYHFQKSILKDTNGHNIATYSHAVPCVDPIYIRFIQYLIADHPIETNRTSFILNKEYRGIKLSPLESNCLFYLIRKKSKLEIAKILNMPVTTINLFINNIKTQLKITHIREILDISILNGYINIVPPGIYNQLSHVKNKFENSINIQLTNREMDCAKLLIKGYRIKEIASNIHLSPRTVETHLNNLKMKLDCRDKIELIIKLRDLFQC